MIPLDALAGPLPSASWSLILVIVIVAVVVVVGLLAWLLSRPRR